MRNWLVALLAVLGVALVTVVVYISLPSSTSVDITAEASDMEANHGRVIYSVPDLDLEHYRLTDEVYLDYVMDGYFSVGKDDPTSVVGFYHGYVRDVTLDEVDIEGLSNEEEEEVVDVVEEDLVGEESIDPVEEEESNAGEEVVEEDEVVTEEESVEEEENEEE